MSSEELSARVTRLEQAWERAQMTIAGTEQLAQAGDRDLADMTQALRAQRHLIQAISITQAEHTETLLRHEELLLRHTGMLNTANEQLRHIVTLLNQLIARPDGE